MFNQKKYDINKNELTDALPFLNKSLHVGRKAPIEYETLRQNGVNERNQLKKDNAKELLIKTIAYNNKNGNKISFKLNENEALYDFFDRLTEEQLYKVDTMLEFAHDPIHDDPKRRLIVTIPEHDSMNYIIGILKKKIPGFAEQLEIDKLKGDASRAEVMISELERKKAERQQSFRVKKDFQKKKAEHTCSVCDKVLKTAGGLGSHMSSQHPEEYKKLKGE